MIPNRLSTCPNCGRPAETVPGAPGNRSVGLRSARSRSGRHPLKLDASHWTQTDRVVGGSTAVLLVSLFLPWFGVSAFGMTATVDALVSHSYLHVVLVMCAAILGYLVLRISSLRSVLPRPGIHNRLLLAVTTFNFVIVIIGFISTPGGPLLSREYGAFTGGIAALVAVLPLAAAVFNFYG